MGTTAMTDFPGNDELLVLDPDASVISVAPWLESLLGSDVALAGTPLVPAWLSPEDWKRLLQTLEGAESHLLLTRRDGVGIEAVVRVTARQNAPGICLSLLSRQHGSSSRHAGPDHSRRASWRWDLLNDAIFERDEEGLIESWNSAAEQLFGIAEATALGRNRFELVRTELPLPVDTINRQLRQSGSWSATLTHRHATGRELRTTCHWVLRRDGNGQAAGVIEIHRDLGDAALAMRESAFFVELHSILFESETDEQLGRRVLPLLASHSGWQAAELWLFPSAALRGDPVDADEGSCLRSAHWLGPDARHHEQQLPMHPRGAATWTRNDFPPRPQWFNPSAHGDGSSRPWRTILTIPLRSATHQLGALIFYSTGNLPEDPRLLTQLAQIGIQLGQWVHRHASEQRLRRSEERFRALMESAPDALVITDERGIVTMANRQTEKLFGWQRQQLLGQSIEMLLPMRFRTRHVHHRNQFAAHPHARPMGVGLELAALRADGTEFPVEISLSPIQIDGEKLVAAAIRDASERRDMEQTQHRLHQLEMAQAEHLASLGQLAAGMAHEIKNPLAGMSAALEVLASQNELPAAAAEIMGEVQHQATRIRKIVDELLNYARPRPAELILADLNATVEQAIPFAALQAQARGVTVALKSTPLPPVLHDPEQIHRLVLNLLMNAIDASHAGGSVELRTALASSQQHPNGVCAIDPQNDGVRPAGADAPRHTVTVCVTDHGSGIEKEDLERIFVPFYTTKGSRGTGLGLSLCRRIAELHGGTLSAASTPGEGSRFTLTLPLQPEPDRQTISGANFGQTEHSHR